MPGMCAFLEQVGSYLKSFFAFFPLITGLPLFDDGMGGGIVEIRLAVNADIRLRRYFPEASTSRIGDMSCRLRMFEPSAYPARQMISVQNVSKLYRVYESPTGRLKEILLRGRRK